MSENYKVTVVRSSKELSTKERIKAKNTSKMVRLKDLCASEPLIIKPIEWVELEVHNEKVRNGNIDYRMFVIVSEDGTYYSTSSEPFFETFMDIYEEMKEEKEPWEIEVSLQDSKNFAGQKFLTCDIL